MMLCVLIQRITMHRHYWLWNRNWNAAASPVFPTLVGFPDMSELLFIESLF